MNRLGLKISCLLAAIVIWIQVAATSVVEQDIMMPLRVTGLQSGLTIAGSDLPAEIPVRVRGSKLRLLRHDYFNKFVGEVLINLAGRNPGPAFVYPVDVSDILTDGLDDAAVSHLTKPLLIHIDQETSRRLPVRLVLVNKLPQDRAFLEEPSVTPDSVMVTGPARYFDPLPEIMTTPLDLGRAGTGGDVELDLSAPSPYLLLEPDHALASLPVGVIEERTLANIPVISLVDAGRPEVGVSPPVASVTVRGVADSLRTLTRDRLLVTISVGDRPVGVYRLPGHVDFPSWLTLLDVDPSEFLVIVGNPPLPDAVAGRDSSSGDSFE
ncbi:hypothetical protein KJ682_00460 [bacterium]|nr:hypothetical protein [bacterium]